MISTYLLLHGLWIISILLGAVFLSQALRTHRSPASTAAWLLLVLLVPILGLLIYLVFGTRKSKYSISREHNIELTAKEEVPVSDARPMDQLVRHFGFPGATGGNDLHIHPTAPECWQGLVDLIESAERFIHIQTFLLHLDDVGKPILDRLCEKARNGVEVRLLVDSLGTLPTRYTHLKPLVEAGGEVVMFDPLLHGHGRTNLRNHRKIAIADAKRVFAGGTNIASEYLGPTPLKDRWKDLSFTLHGPAVSHYCEIFKSDWKFASKKELDEQYVVPPEGIQSFGDDEVQIIPSGPDVKNDVLYDSIILGISMARRRVRCVTPYFIPDETLNRVLALAAKRGVEVDIIVPRKSNHGVANIARGPYLRQLEAAGANIQFYEPGMVHAKLTMIDDAMAMIGSTNLDQRSLFLNYEVSAIIWKGDAIAGTSKWIDQLVAKSNTGNPKAGSARQTVEGLMQVVAPLL